MKQGICYLVCAGKNTGLDFTPTANDYVIAVDGGLRYLEEARIKPNLIIGDFDTLGYCPTHSNVVRLNPQKDETDTLAALKEGILEGFSQFHLYCGTGGASSIPSPISSCWPSCPKAAGKVSFMTGSMS